MKPSGPMRILVLTDFSERAFNAARYAASFSKAINAEIVLLHSIISVQSTFISERERDEENTKRFKEAEGQMKAAVQRITDNFFVPLKSSIVKGPVRVFIDQVLKEEKIDLVIMGTEGANGIGAALFGSYTTNFIKRASCPVLTVPPGLQYQQLKDILCATELHKSEYPAIKKLADLARSFSSKITFLYIDEDDTKADELQNFESPVRKLIQYDNIDFKVKKGGDVVDTLEDYASEGRYDLMVTLGKQQGFLKRLMGLSITEDLCLRNAAPILAFPHSD